MRVECHTPKPTIGGRRILIIDDQRDVRLLMQVVLTKLGHAVIAAENGSTGIELARINRPEIVFCDIVLATDMDGYEVAKRLRQEPASVGAYLVALTGRNSDEDRQRASLAGFDAHAVKPVDLAKLQQLIAAAPCD